MNNEPVSVASRPYLWKWRNVFRRFLEYLEKQQNKQNECGQWDYFYYSFVKIAFNKYKWFLLIQIDTSNSQNQKVNASRYQGELKKSQNNLKELKGHTMKYH